MESYFGQLGTPTTALQQQSLGGISQFLNSNPYGQSNAALQGILGGGNFNEANQAYRNVGNANYFGDAKNAFNQLGSQNFFGGAENAFNQLGNQNFFGQAQQGFGGAQDFFKNLAGQNLFGGVEGGANQLKNANYFDPAKGVFSRLENFNPFGAAQASLEGQLGTNPGQGVLDALRPQYERNLAEANQTGGRFGSANAILKSRAVDDYNLLGAQALQQGVSQQQNAAGILGSIGNSLIGARSAAGQGMLGVGQGQAGLASNALQALLGAAQGRLSQGLGAGQGLLGAAQGQLGVGQGRLSQAVRPPTGSWESARAGCHRLGRQRTACSAWGRDSCRRASGPRVGSVALAQALGQQQLGARGSSPRTPTTCSTPIRAPTGPGPSRRNRKRSGSSRRWASCRACSGPHSGPRSAPPLWWARPERRPVPRWVGRSARSWRPWAAAVGAVTG
jgi:hypothetical protein